MPPRHSATSFGDRAYWDNRFAKESHSFDWLQDGDSLVEPITECIREVDPASRATPAVLHIGCGSSKLSLKLPTLVVDPRFVLNVDISEPAIRLGKGMERGYDGEKQLEERLGMHWQTANLLSLVDVSSIAAVHGCDFRVVVDKSTSDAIACAEDVPVQLPYHIHDRAASSQRTRRPVSQGAVYPVHLLAVHLAYLCGKGARWIVLSYSEHRFPFLDPKPTRAEDGALSAEVVNAGFPDPADLWHLVEKRAVQAPSGSVADTGTVHQPVVNHALYVLERTERELCLSACSR